LRSDSPLRRDLARALTRVSEMDKRILLSGLTETQLSLELGLKPGAIRVRRRRAKEKLRTVLREMGHVA
jgi:DNA-directed RNA polymerase specialized sigma24 family protein